DSSIIDGGRIGNQSIDHYTTVIQIAGFMAQNGFNVKINHYDDADIVATREGFTIAIEYERTGSHSVSDLIEKKKRAETTYGRMVFVVTAENERKMKSILGADCVVRRGTMFAEFVQTLIGGGYKCLQPILATEMA
ncbi:MAG: hypothetical protein JXA38_04635, partial [Methanosarcinaceae archaeon]|nr:hypothetical protein [Methanosarcinaceae archaeon]